FIIRAATWHAGCAARSRRSRYFIKAWGGNAWTAEGTGGRLRCEEAGRRLYQYDRDLPDPVVPAEGNRFLMRGGCPLLQATLGFLMRRRVPATAGHPRLLMRRRVPATAGHPRRGR